MSEQTGPNKRAAKIIFEATLKPTLQNETNVPARFIDEVNRMIDESIIEGVEEAHKGYTLCGWMVYGRKDSVDAIRRIYKEKEKNFKSNMKKETHKKLAFGLYPTDTQNHIADFVGGRRKKQRKIRGKYTLKKRKSIKRIKKKKRRTGKQ
ncbi:hypothetical protein N9O88_01775 [bacterium]|nr:hypothetical protein [bacterium]